MGAPSGGLAPGAPPPATMPASPGVAPPPAPPGAAAPLGGEAAGCKKKSHTVVPDAPQCEALCIEQLPFRDPGTVARPKTYTGKGATWPPVSAFPPICQPVDQPHCVALLACCAPHWLCPTPQASHRTSPFNRVSCHDLLSVLCHYTPATQYPDKLCNPTAGSLGALCCDCRFKTNSGEPPGLNCAAAPRPPSQV